MWNRGDGLWNNGEGFGTVASGFAPDLGGWRGVEEDPYVTAANLYPYVYGPTQTAAPPIPPATFPWHAHVWTDPYHQNSGQSMRRCVGYLRPTQVSLLTGFLHPDSRIRQHPQNHVPWVDDAAIEIFVPASSRPRNGRPVVLCLGLLATFGAPPGVISPLHSIEGVLVYPGVHSPDGLLRTPPLAEDQWFNNVQQYLSTPQELARPFSDAFVGRWMSLPDPSLSWWPVAIYVVPRVPLRQSELIHQRNLQLLAAAKSWLVGVASAIPLPDGFGDPVAASDIAVVYSGGSNGGLQSTWALLRAQDRIHGAFTSTMTPSKQMLYDEQEIGYTVGHLSGLFTSGAGLGSMEQRDWMSFVWNRNLMLRDLSLAAQFLIGQVVRPVCMFVGDEDITSTGTDWIRRMSSNDTWSGSGVNGTFAWMAADKRCHEGGEVTKPYSGPLMPGLTTYQEYDVAMDLAQLALQSRAQPAPSPVPARNNPPSDVELKDSEDASEWVFGRRWTPPPSGGALVEDTAFFNGSQPGWAGTALGKSEAILITGGRVIVGSAEGVVSAFEVNTTDPRRPLVRVAQASPDDESGNPLPAGTPLGHSAFGLAKLDSHFVVGTRRHLIKLNSALEEVARIPLSWQRAKPYRIRVADVIVNATFPGEDIVIASGHGPLLVVDQNLGTVFEYKEAVRDLVAPAISYSNGGTASTQPISLLSNRGLIANITLDPSLPGFHKAKLQAASPPFPDHPIDLERYDAGGAEGLVALCEWDKRTLRGYSPSNLALLWETPDYHANHPQGASDYDVATARNGGGGGGVDDLVPGEHIVVLDRGRLYLFNEQGSPIGTRKDLSTYLPASGATAIAIGELATPDPNGSVPSGPYAQEIVIATMSGRLVWFHMNEIAAPGTSLEPFAALTPGSAIQPRTNQSLSCTWSIASDGGATLDVLELNGMHWSVPVGGGSPVLVRGEPLVHTNGVGRTWARATGPTSTTALWTQMPSSLPAWVRGLQADVWYPDPAPLAVYELQPWLSNPPPIWKRFFEYPTFLDDHLILPGSGDVIADGTGYQAHYWSKFTGVLAGFQVDGTQKATGYWSSTDHPSGSPPQAGVLFRNLRTPGSVVYHDMQALKAFRLPSASGDGAVRLALGLPGGKVGVYKPAAFNTAGDVGIMMHESEDFGHGGTALAVRSNGTTTDIFFGVATRHAARGGFPQTLSNQGVLTGGIGWWEYSESGGSGQLTPRAWRDLTPGSSATGPRGGYGVMGMAVGDLLPSNGGGNNDLVVTTLAGDLFVFDITSPTTFQQDPMYRTWVPGGLGLYNSLVITDLDDSTTGNELYAAGSIGIRKWRRP